LLDWKKQDLLISEGKAPSPQRTKTDKFHENLPDDISHQFKDIHLLKMNTDKNVMKKTTLIKQLTDNFEEASRINNDIQGKIKEKDKRDKLDLLLKNNIMELQCNEMDYQLRKQAKLIEDLNKIITKQGKLLTKHKINYNENKFVVLTSEDNLDDPNPD